MRFLYQRKEFAFVAVAFWQLLVVPPLLHAPTAVIAGTATASASDGQCTQPMDGACVDGGGGGGGTPPVEPTAAQNASIFARVENDLRHYGDKEVYFNFWVFEDDEELQDEVPYPSLPIPDFVRVFELNPDQASASFQDVGKAAREVIEDNLSATGAVLFRKLHQRIANATDFKEFWNHVMVSEEKGDWSFYRYDGRIGNIRNQINGFDTTDAIDAEELLGLHSEMAYNPIPCTKVMFYGLQDAIGGDTVLVRNADMAKAVPEDVKPFFEAHGGVRHKKFFFNDPENQPLSMEWVTWKNEKRPLSWQWTAGTTDVEEAIEYFVGRGYKKEDIIITEDGDLEVSFVHPGYLVDEESGEDLWYNNQNHSPTEMADGTEMPEDMIDDIILASWQSAYGLHLELGDWLVLDNFKVMHGRTPYEQISPDLPRTLLTVYTK